MKQAKMSILFLLSIGLISIFHGTASGQTPGINSGLRAASTPSSGLEVSLIFGRIAYRFDKFKALDSNDEKTRLDYFLSELQRDSTLTGLIVVFGKRGGPPSEAKKRAENAKNYLLNKLPTSNLMTIDYCTRAAVEYELWIVPKGKKPPVFCSKPRSIYSGSIL